MKTLRLLKAFIFVEVSCFFLSVLFLWLRILPPLATLVLALLTQLIALIHVYLTVIRPLSRLEKTLKNSFLDEGWSDTAALLTGDTAYLREIHRLIERSTAYHIRKSSAEMFDRQAELAALQSQINPHFLYNALETIRAQALINDNVDIAKMVEALAAFFRYNISHKGSLVTLRDELSSIKNYMTIQRYRFPNRFSPEIHLGEDSENAYDCFIPKLIIQPVVENAFYHGLNDVLEGGKIKISINLTPQSLIITVSDNGKGMDLATLKALNQKIHNPDRWEREAKQQGALHMGIALTNIHKRIQILFGERYGLQVYSVHGQGTDVEITVPADAERNIE